MQTLLATNSVSRRMAYSTFPKSNSVPKQMPNLSHTLLKSNDICNLTFSSSQLAQVNHGSHGNNKSIPTLDFTNYEQLPKDQKILLGQKLFNALQTHTIAYIKGHGLSPLLIKKHYQLVEEMLRLDPHILNKYRSEPYSLTGLQSNVGFNALNKAAFVDPKRFVIKYRNKENRLPIEEELPGFEANNRLIFDSLNRLGVQVAESLGLYMNQQGYVANPNFFKDMISDDKGEKNFNVLWINKYPRHFSENDTGEIPIGAKHKDTSLLTLLPPASIPGLQVLNPETKQWLPVELPLNDDRVAILSSGLMSKITEKLIPHNIHRVISQPNSTEGRTSLTFFLLPHRDAPITKLNGSVLYESGALPAKHCLLASAEPMEEHLVTLQNVKMHNPAFGHQLKFVIGNSVKTNDPSI
jgi:isopenicillin N synthase-like dioxygenase